eukprot:5227460-Amphidinium_carterae.1
MGQHPVALKLFLPSFQGPCFAQNFGQLVRGLGGFRREAKILQLSAELGQLSAVVTALSCNIQQGRMELAEQQPASW